MDSDKRKVFIDNMKNLLSLFEHYDNILFYILIENNAFKSDFIDKIVNNQKLINDDLSIPEDLSFSEFKGFFNDIINDYDSESNLSELSAILNDKLLIAINSDDYEEAIKLREYMKKRGIRKK